MNQPNVWPLLARLAVRYHCSTDYLLGLTDDSSPRTGVKLPAGSPELLKLFRELSEVRRKELLRIAEALYDLEQEAAAGQPTVIEEGLEKVKDGSVPRIIG